MKNNNKIKYLKYKKKYFDLKDQIGRGFTFYYNIPPQHYASDPVNLPDLKLLEIFRNLGLIPMNEEQFNYFSTQLKFLLRRKINIILLKVEK